MAHKSLRWKFSTSCLGPLLFLEMVVLPQPWVLVYHLIFRRVCNYCVTFFDSLVALISEDAWTMLQPVNEDTLKLVTILVIDGPNSILLPWS